MTQKSKATKREDDRLDFAAAYKAAAEQLRIAQGTVKTKTLETALWGWRWGCVVNDIHGGPAATGGPVRGAISSDQMLAYCAEMGFSRTLSSNGHPSGATKVNALRRVAARITSEDHLRELVATVGSIWRIAQELGGEDHDRNQRHNRESSRRQNARKTATSHSKFSPPQSWSSYLIEQNMSRGEISAAMCVALEAIGPEETFKLWDRAGRPTRYHSDTGYAFDPETEDYI